MPALKVPLPRVGKNPVLQEYSASSHKGAHLMNVYQCIEHFDREFGLHPLIDSLFGEQGTEGGFPLPSAPDGSKQALLYDEYGLWVLSQALPRSDAEDRIRHFPFTIMTSCILRQGEGVRQAFEDSTISHAERMERVLRGSVIEVSISDSFFHFEGGLIADVVTDSNYFAEIVDDFFGILRSCTQYGVPVEAVASMGPALVGAGAR